MNDILYEFKNLHHFKDSLTFGVKVVLDTSEKANQETLAKAPWS